MKYGSRTLYKFKLKVLFKKDNYNKKTITRCRDYFVCIVLNERDLRKE